MGFKDFAGCAVVHMLGGVCSLVACGMIGPRRGRFTKTGQPIEMSGHSVPLAGLGGFILLFGFLAFNGGSQVPTWIEEDYFDKQFKPYNLLFQLQITAEGDADVVGLILVNTILGGCGGGLTVLFMNKFLFGTKWSYLLTLNGALTGMVSQCAGCNVFPPWASLIIGCFGGLAYEGVHYLMLKVTFDDPLDAVAVHGGGGKLEMESNTKTNFKVFTSY